MPETQCKLKRDNGTEHYDVAELIARYAKETPPLLTWVEVDPMAVNPKGSAGRRIDSLPLIHGMPFPSWVTELPLTEARLFWNSSAIHIIRRGERFCQWARIEENDSGEDIIRDEINVFTLRDRKRFGLEGRTTIDSLRAIQYWHASRLVAWRLIPEDKHNVG